VYPYRADDRIFTQMPFFWVGGLTLSTMPVMHSGATMLCSAKTGSELLDFCEKERMTYMVGWPHTARMMADDPSFLKRDWSAMRGGRLHELLPGAKPRNHFANNMGMTETCGSHHMSLPHLPEDLRESLGIPMPGTERRIVDIDSGLVITDEKPGVLQVRGDAVLIGMVGREPADVFDADGWYSTGDIASVRRGHIFFHGRLDDVIKASGANVSPREVEAVLTAIPGVAQAIVSGVPDPVRGTVVGAVIATKPGATLDAEAIRARAAKSLSAYKVPRRIAFVDAAKLPMMSSGKFDRRALLRLLGESAETA
jgi:acyl-CoA synthetase (AMP-forming)/AMP-acid ligase II